MYEPKYKVGQRVLLNINDKENGLDNRVKELNGKPVTIKSYRGDRAKYPYFIEEYESTVFSEYEFKPIPQNCIFENV